MTPSCSSISYFPSAQTRNSRNGPTAAFPEDSIPAHAGKTTPTRRPWCGSSAHPRSRGENQQRLDLGAESRGSSPLTRGKPRPQSWQKRASRLIPAHAGKTRCQLRLRRRGRAHPRSRGENAILLGVPFTTAGSSPLTRGKRDVCPSERGRRRLIPAHAGKTIGRGDFAASNAAHPRSRGENTSASRAGLLRPGSSPLTRGKHRRRRPDSAARRLIPAHAGKTWRLTVTVLSATAHPRSRGENARGVGETRTTRGSSPLTRGKPEPLPGLVVENRLIPAHAGKTTCSGPRMIERSAHPRSRGENIDEAVSLPFTEGSSPLTRGKRV